MSTLTNTFACLIALTLSAHADGAIIYVNGTATGGNTGASWADARTSLRQALNQAVAGDEIWVARGLYRPDSNAQNISYELKSGVKVFGGFVGTETLLSQRIPDPNPGVPDPATDTVLSGDLGLPGFGDNTFNIVKAVGVDSSAALDGFTITGGEAGTGGTGAGLNSVNSSPRIAHCNFIENTGNSGAAVLIDAGSPTFSNCVFKENSAAPNRGGAAYAFRGAAAAFNGCTFQDNDAIVGGGAISFVNANGSLTGCIFTGNVSGGEGGAIELIIASPAITACTFSDNHASLSNGASGGGGVWTFSSSPTIARCAFAFNSATQGGAVFASQNSVVTLVNSLLTANASLIGGAGFSTNSSLAFINCTVVNNDDTANFAGASHGPTTFTNSIVRNLGPEASSATFTRCNVEGTAPGVGNFDADPLFVDAPNGNFALQQTSPCIDAGDNTALPSGNPIDFAGNPRFKDITSVADTGVGPAPVVDIGAFEAQPPPCIADLTGDGQVNTADLVRFLGSFGQAVPPGTSGDFNNDAVVNTSDLVFFLARFGTTCP